MANKLSQLKNKLGEQNLDALLITSVPNITYFTGYSNFSKDEREAFVLIAKNKQFIITDARYSEAIKQHVSHFSLIELMVSKRFEQIFEQLIKTHNLKRVGFEENNIVISEYKKLRLPPLKCKARFVGSKDILEDLRIIKNGDEIEKIEQACKLADKAFAYVLAKIKKGVTEQELAFEMEFFIKKHSANISFPPIVAFGENAAIPHHQTGRRKLNNNEFVLLDFGVQLNNYCSDMTRTVFFGKANKEQKRIYSTVLQAQELAFKHISNRHSGDSGICPEDSRMTGKEVDSIARSYIISQDFPSIPHSLGHGIGIEVHEAPKLSPVSKDKLKPGMVFSLEPGIYIPNQLGVRIEDIVVLEINSPRFLTYSSKQLIEL